MLDDKKIAEVAAQVADGQLSDVHLRRVVSEPMTDSEGRDALRLTLVLEPEDAKRLTGDQALDLLVAIQQRLHAEGEFRSPVVGYATEQELLAEDDA